MLPSSDHRRTYKYKETANVIQTTVGAVFKKTELNGLLDTLIGIRAALFGGVGLMS